MATSINVSPGLNDLLAQQADPDSGPHEQAAVVGLIEPSQDLDQGGLAGAVGPDQPDPLAGADLEIESLKIGSPLYCRPSPWAEMRIIYVS